MPSTVSFLLEKNENLSNQRASVSTAKRRNKQMNQGEATLLEENEEEEQDNENDLFSPDELDTAPRPKEETIASPVRQRVSKIPVRSTNASAFQYFQAKSSSVSNTPTTNDDRKRLESSDEEIENENLKANDLKLKLKEEKRRSKKNGALLTKLHKNYEELLEKYAHAENTIDQLRFQPKISGDNTPRSTTAELIHLDEQSKVNIATVRSSGIYRSLTTGSPLSSIRPVPSTASPTSPKKSISPNNSSVFFDETTPKKDKKILNETKTLKHKMKTFLTLMDANQLSCTEQKQVYENIKQDYEKLAQLIEQDHDNLDLNQEFETMRHLLKEIVKKITNNLLGKSLTDSSPERQMHDDSRSMSARSSICNHQELMDQYERLLNAVNTPIEEPSKHVETKKTDAYIYISGNSDNDLLSSRSVTPIRPPKKLHSTSFELDHIPSKVKIRPAIKSEYDSGIGTTKLSQDSKLYANTMDESHFQSLDADQNSISSSSSSNSTSFSRRNLNQRARTNSYRAQLETHRTRSFAIQPQISSSKKPMHRSHHTWRPARPLSSHRSRLVPLHRSTSVMTPVIEDYPTKSYRSTNSPFVSSKLRAQPSYRSSIYINDIHASKEPTDENLYLDPHTGIVYQWASNKKVYSQPKLYRCDECGTVTNYHHRHHIQTVAEDLGYESGQKKRDRRHRYVEYVSSSSSSDSDSDFSDSYYEIMSLNRAYQRAEKVQQHSRCLSRYILRQLKLALATL